MLYAIPVKCEATPSNGRGSIAVWVIFCIKNGRHFETGNHLNKTIIEKNRCGISYKPVKYEANHSDGVGAIAICVIFCNKNGRHFVALVL